MSIVPKEVLWMVLSRSGPSCFGIFRLVCKYWKRVIESKDFKNYVESHCPIKFSDEHFSLFANSPSEPCGLSVDKFVSQQNIADGFIEDVDTFSSTRFDYVVDYDPTREDDPDYVRHKRNNKLRYEKPRPYLMGPQSYRCVLQSSLHGNQDNWNISKVPNSIQVSTINKSSLLDVFFPIPKFIHIKEPTCKGHIEWQNPVLEPPPPMLYGHIDVIFGGG